MARETDSEPSHILEHVYLGCRAHARDKDLLQRFRITHILNVTPPKKMDPVAGVPNFFEKDQLFTYRRCSIFDNKAEDISRVLEGCIAFIAQAKYYGRILVHCNKGVSRSSSMVIAYLMKLHSMTFDHALAFVVKCRPLANPNESFRRQLQDYERLLQRSAPKSKRVRAQRGIVGPQLPLEAKSNDSVPSIGPQLPIPTSNDNNGNTTITKEDSVIEPNLPPHFKRPITSTDEKAYKKTKRTKDCNN